MTPPQISLQLRNFAVDDSAGWNGLFAHAVAADRAGIDRITVSDHVVFGEQLDAYGDPKLGGVAGGQQPTGPDGHWLEPLTLLTWLAAKTERVRVGTGILLAALRRPVVLAKALATMDVLSGGRIDLGVGVGWQQEEYEAAGLDFSGRGRLLDHSIEVCQALWRNDAASYDSPELSFTGIHQAPKPVQPGGVPVWFGGGCNQRTARRIAHFGTGWIPWPTTLDPLAVAPQMRELVAAEGGNADQLQILGYTPTVRRADRSLDIEATVAPVPELVAAGVTDVRINVPVPPDLDDATDALGQLVAAFRSATS